ncbi:hypothetical protein BO70DRAFT_379865 [Aspergillus heteromorphus CBS 117.55]|uniref:Uncharacterized protein n=1 Tax=Aspergillus heteromorphus CBS 117.55 TaxID=1448321 RepID=A0A317W7P0_9EURO|nr:uncharacterized protein BO70DRAFT_379865 [Aspergillus heteromorphus CBS 117.55]PWY81905.1 hypothetical protein BO70DRAFT_379865 [Aspergillus heteromorphus CBS 117.55]
MDDFDPDLTARPEFQVIIQLLQSPEASPIEAVQRLLQAREDQQQSQKEPRARIDGNHAWFTMLSLVELATLTPAAEQTKLVGFVSQLQQTPVTDPTTGETPTAIDLNLWTDLPYLRVYLGDRFGFNYSTQNSPAEIQEWENRNAFMAQLTAAADHLGHAMDFSIYGLYTFEEAFEKDKPVEEAVRTACVWFIFAGKRLWENCRAGRVFGGEGDPPRRGFDLERWQLWKGGIGAARLAIGGGDSQELVAKASAEMEGAEGQ